MKSEKKNELIVTRYYVFGRFQQRDKKILFSIDFNFSITNDAIHILNFCREKKKCARTRTITARVTTVLFLRGVSYKLQSFILAYFKITDMTQRKWKKKKTLIEIWLYLPIYITVIWLSSLFCCCCFVFVFAAAVPWLFVVKVRRKGIQHLHRAHTFTENFGNRETKRSKPIASFIQ